MHNSEWVVPFQGLTWVFFVPPQSVCLILDLTYAEDRNMRSSFSHRLHSKFLVPFLSWPFGGPTSYVRWVPHASEKSRAMLPLTPLSRNIDTTALDDDLTTHLLCMGKVLSSTQSCGYSCGHYVDHHHLWGFSCPWTFACSMWGLIV